MEQHEMIGLTVSDGFKFGCGFFLASAIGLLAALVVLTGFMAVGVLLGVRVPFFGG